MRENKGKCDRRRLKIAKFFRTWQKSEREGGERARVKERKRERSEMGSLEKERYYRKLVIG